MDGKDHKDVPVYFCPQSWTISISKTPIFGVLKEDIPRQGRAPKPKTLLAKRGKCLALGYGLEERGCGSCSWLQSVLSAPEGDLITPLGQHRQQELLCKSQDCLILMWFCGVPPSHLQRGWEAESKLLKVFWGPLWPLNCLNKGKGEV